MPESNLSLNLDNLRTRVGEFFGIGRTYSSAVATDQARIDEIISSGLRQFYFPKPPATEQGSAPPHVWSFLRRTQSIALIVGTAVYALPDDCSGAIDRITYSAGGNQQAIRMIPEGQLRALQAADQRNASPTHAAVMPLMASGAAAFQRHELHVYPKPAAVETIVIGYTVIPSAPTAPNDCPIGGTVHVEAILAACLAAGEELLGRASTVERTRFNELLAASIALDMQRTPATIPTHAGIAPTYGSRSWLAAEVGEYLQFGSNAAEWTHDQAADIESILERGLRQFYFPAPIDGRAHDWSFLRPVTSLATIADTWQYDLPPEYGGLDGDITFVTTSATYYSIPIVSESSIRQSRQSQPITSGRPQLAAIRPLVSTGAAAQKFQLLLWPTPDAVYNLEYRYMILARGLTKAAPYPYGSEVHAETILESCLAIAETRKELVGRGKYQVPTVHRTLFIERLATSISLDSRQHRAEKFGYNGDRSDERHRGSRRRRDEVVVTYNGVAY